MPALRAPLLRRLCAAYRRGDEAVLPVVNGQRGNPALLGRPLFTRVLAELRGDQGARRLIAQASRVREVRGDAGCRRDIDTRRQWALKPAAQTRQGLSPRRAGRPRSAPRPEPSASVRIRSG
ncbi:NTP transferase domain-containing protein [Solimonas soli]|uniref:NTP transferase domain-containing protein n=1 Tax=Solimonas soli TaxID=413479 RepID=UPI0004B6BCC6|nr:NTP transferase domain-containing protein [Solimonas soli]